MAVMVGLAGWREAKIGGAWWERAEVLEVTGELKGQEAMVRVLSGPF